VVIFAIFALLITLNMHVMDYCYGYIGDIGIGFEIGNIICMSILVHVENAENDKNTF
jgi:hypothetical protein